MFKRSYRTIYFLLLLFFLVTCSSCTIKLGINFDGNKVEDIQIGKTTQDQIQDLLGLPASVGKKNGNSLWTYLYAEVPLIIGSPKGSALSIEFDHKGIVETYSYIPY